MIGSSTICSVSFSNLEELLSCPKLDLGFNLKAAFMTSDGDTGSMKILCGIGSGSYDLKLLFDFGTL